jgi:hypothetical protein
MRCPDNRPHSEPADIRVDQDQRTCAASLVRERFDLPIKAPQHSRGRGLGLPTAHYLALINGGAVEIAASGVLGVLFEIVLPRAPLR